MNRNGFALITALALMVVLMMVATVLVTGTVGELHQSKSSLVVSQTRAAAEAGTTYARVVLTDSAQNDMKSILAPYATDFVTQGKNPAADWVIPSSDWSSVAAQLQHAQARPPSRPQQTRLLGINPAPNNSKSPNHNARRPCSPAGATNKPEHRYQQPGLPLPTTPICQSRRGEVRRFG